MMRLGVTGMTCEGCAAAVRRAVQAVDQKAEVAVDLAGGLLEIDGTVDRQRIVQAIERAGFGVEEERP
jgi:copper chaperone